MCHVATTVAHDSKSQILIQKTVHTNGPILAALQFKGKIFENVAGP
jgi:hypothetical protein